MDTKEFFILIADYEVEYFVSDYCREKQERTISAHVKRQVDERLIKADTKQKNTNFIIALIYDQGSNDNYTQEKRIQFQRTDLLSEFNIACDKIKPFKCKDQNKKLRDISKFINENKISSIKEYIEQNDIGTVKQVMDNIYGVGPKLTDWSITNVTGKEYVIDGHIARVLYRLGVVSEREHKRYRNNPCYTEVNNEFKKVSEEYFADFGDYKGFAATQYLWFFGKHICKKENPLCINCKISNCNYRN